VSETRPVGSGFANHAELSVSTPRKNCVFEVFAWTVTPEAIKNSKQKTANIRFWNLRKMVAPFTTNVGEYVFNFVNFPDIPEISYCYF
jgi:hypothetical protein